MREIKFRALSMCRGERWVYGDLRHYAHNPHTEKWTIHDPTTGLETDIDETTVGQFTGLYDKNGKEIYEGDVVRTMLSEKPFGVVVWHSCGYFYVCENWSANIRESDHLPLGHLMQQVIGEKKVEIEVIGNIYDNPEILKE